MSDRQKLYSRKNLWLSDEEDKEKMKKILSDTSSPTVRQTSAIFNSSCPETFLKSPIFEDEEEKEKENVDEKEIVLELEQDLQHLSNDESVIYYSLLCEDSSLDTLEDTVCLDACTVEPSTIILTPPDKCTDMILLNNGNNKKLYFEIMSKPEGLQLSSYQGIIQPGQTVIIKLTYDFVICKGITDFKVKVLVDNECYDVDVKVYLNFNKLK